MILCKKLNEEGCFADVLLGLQGSRGSKFFAVWVLESLGSFVALSSLIKVPKVYIVLKLYFGSVENLCGYYLLLVAILHGCTQP